MTKKQKFWVHTRFVLKFVPLQLFGVFVNIYGVGFVVLFWFLFGFSNFLFIWLLISLFFLPIAIILRGKFNPLVFMLDNSRLTKTFELSEDYENWLNGRMINFKTDWLWHNRNRIKNLIDWIVPDKGDEYLVQLLQNELTFRDHTIELTNDEGFMKNDYFAGLKWITKSRAESFQTHSGVKISYDYSIFGTMELYYRVGISLYYKYSKCVLWFKTWKWIPIIGGKDIWYTFKYHANNKLGTIHLKLQWEK